MWNDLNYSSLMPAEKKSDVLRLFPRKELRPSVEQDAYRSQVFSMLLKL